MKLRLVIVTSLWVLSSCAVAPEGTLSSSPEAGYIRQSRLDQNAAIAAGDLDRVASYWTESVVVTAGLGTSLHGRDAYRRAFEQDSRIVYRRETEEIEVSSDYPIAWEHGTWSGISGSRGAPMIAGRYSAQWVRIGEHWRIRSELFVALECSGVACNWPVSGL